MTHRGRLWGARVVLLLALPAAAGEAVVEDEKLASARDLFEQFVFAEHAEAHDQLEALGAIAERVESAPEARGLLPLYRLALRSPRITDEDVALAVADGFALCLVRAGRPFAAVRDALRREAKERAGTVVSAGLLAVAERFNRLCESPRVAGREAAARRLSSTKAARSGKQPLLIAAGRGRTARPAASSPALDVGPRAIGVKGAGAIAAPGEGARAKAPDTVGRPGETARPATGGPGPVDVTAARARAVAVGALRPSRSADHTVVAVIEAFAASVEGGPGLGAESAVARPRVGPVAVAGAQEAAKAKVVTPGAAPVGRSREAIRAAVDKAATSALGQLVKELTDEAAWMVRRGDHETALDILGEVVADASDTAFSAEALSLALAIALASRKDASREDTLAWFERWAAERGGKRDRIQARLLALQQRYRDGGFVAARDGLRGFVAKHPDSELAPRARLLLALATWRAGEREKAIALLGGLVWASPSHPVAPRAQFLVGYLRFAGGEQQEAQAAFLRVIGDYPNSPFAEKAIDFLGTEAAKHAEAEAERLRHRQLPSAQCRRAAGALRVDGRLDEPAWQRAPVLRLAHKGKGDEQAPEPDPNVAVRLLWDDEALYVAFECTDDDVRSEAKAHDDPVLLWDAVRVLILPPEGKAPGGEPAEEGKPRAYFDFAVGPRGVLADGRVAFERGVILWQSVRAAAAWDAPGVRCAASVDGTLNDEKPDRGWRAELAVPFDALGVQPARGQVWRMNFVWVTRQTGRDRVVTSWSPLGGWLPQPNAFGRITFTVAEQ